MPFSEFVTSGDPKFIIAFLVFTLFAVFHFIKKLQSARSAEGQEAVTHHNTKIDISATWILILSLLTLLLSLMHTFYLIGNTGGIAPKILFTGLSYTLINPVAGLVFYMICKILKGIANGPVPAKS